MTLEIDGATIDTVSAEVVRIGQDEIGLQFLRLTKEQREQLVEIIWDRWGVHSVPAKVP